MSIGKITFTESAKEFILDALGMKINDKGYIIDTKTKDKIVTRLGEYVKIEEFGGFHKDFGIIKSDLNSIIEFADYMKGQQK